MDVFLSFSFGSEDKELVDQLQALLRSHGVRPVTGRVLNGEPVTPAVLQRVASCHGLVALMTRRDRLGGGTKTGGAHPWVRDDQFVRGQGLPSISIVEDGVEIEGAYPENERLPLVREQPLSVFLQLSERLANWKQDFGRKRFRLRSSQSRWDMTSKAIHRGVAGTGAGL